MTAGEAMAIGMLGAAAAGGDPDRLREAIAGAVEVLTAEDIDELLLQTYLFAGFPRTINAFYTWQSWAMRHGGRGEPLTEPMQLESWRERGERLCRLIYGGNFEALQIRLARLHPELAAWTLVDGYGKVLSRPGPAADVREMAAVGALIALGERRQLASHLQGARHTGVEADVLASTARAVAATWDRRSLVDELLTGLDDS
ncbi:MAG: carboxymuconolactone decarboxylase family protein [Gemmatimonadota bacterium]